MPRQRVVVAFDVIGIDEEGQTDPSVQFSRAEAEDFVRAAVVNSTAIEALNDALHSDGFTVAAWRIGNRT